MSSSSGDPEVKTLKKQNTYSSEINAKEPVQDGHLLRSNSLMNKSALSTTTSANARSLSNNHNLSYGNDLSSLGSDKNDSDQKNFKLHRTNEVENLTAEIQSDGLSSQNSKNLRRTFELENLNEIVNDE